MSNLFEFLFTGSLIIGGFWVISKFLFDDAIDDLKKQDYSQNYTAYLNTYPLVNQNNLADYNYILNKNLVKYNKNIELTKTNSDAYEPNVDLSNPFI